MNKLNNLVVGDFVYNYHLDANVEILKVLDRGNSYDTYSSDRHCFVVAGCTAPKDRRFWDLPRKDKETIFHYEAQKGCYAEGYKGILSEDDFYGLVSK